LVSSRKWLGNLWNYLWRWEFAPLLLPRPNLRGDGIVLIGAPMFLVLTGHLPCSDPSSRHPSHWRAHIPPRTILGDYWNWPAETKPAFATWIYIYLLLSAG
jgi:hypothetical protein